MAKTWILTFTVTQEIEASKQEVAETRADTLSSKLQDAIAQVTAKWNIGDAECSYEVEEQDA